MTRLHYRWTNQLAAVGLILLCSVLIATAQRLRLNSLKVESNERSRSQLQREVAQEALELNFLEVVPNFNFKNLMANWSFIKFLIYFGDDLAREHTGYELTPEYFKITLQEDPRFIPAYFSMSASLSLYLGRADFSAEMTQQGLQRLSPKDPLGSYYIWRYLGTDQLLFLGEGQAAEQSFTRATEWAREYSDPESQFIAQISSATAQFLKSNVQSKQAQFQAWQLVLFNATDDRTRQRAIASMEELGGRVILDSDGRVTQLIPPPFP